MSQSILDIKSVLKINLSKALPGSKAHQTLMPNRPPIASLNKVLDKARKSAVLILIYPKNEVNHLVFIQRHAYEGSHGNQISLPGGKVEQEDNSYLETALREANEELKIESSEIEVVGELSPLYIPPSNFVVYPFVAIQTTEPSFIPDKYEVKEVLEIELSHFMKEDALIDKRIVVGGANYMKVRGYPYKERIIWGATGMIINELKAILLGD